MPTDEELGVEYGNKIDRVVALASIAPFVIFAQILKIFCC